MSAPKNIYHQLSRGNERYYRDATRFITDPQKQQSYIRFNRLSDEYGCL